MSKEGASGLTIENFFKLLFFASDAENMLQHVDEIKKKLVRPETKFETMVNILNNAYKENYNNCRRWLTVDKIAEFTNKFCDT